MASDARFQDSEPLAAVAAGSAASSREPNDDRTPLGVVYVGGCQRSGSTLLERLLSQFDGHVCAGEIVHLWVRGLRDNELCGCGSTFRDCRFWSAVGLAAFGGWDRVAVDRVISMQRAVDRNRYIFFMLFPWVTRKYRRKLNAYAALLERLFAGIHQVSDGAVIVDSSKHPSTAFLLRHVAGVRLRVIHLVRDSRGVAFSLRKRVRRPEAAGDEELMHRSSVWRSGVEWSAFNALFHVLRLAGTSTTRVRYEDLARAPGPVLLRVAAAEGVEPGQLSFVRGRRVTLDLDHTVAGNPMRLQRGEVELRVDDDWRNSLDRRDRIVATSLTWPLMAVYGYFGRRAR